MTAENQPACARGRANFCGGTTELVAASTALGELGRVTDLAVAVYKARLSCENPSPMVKMMPSPRVPQSQVFRFAACRLETSSCRRCRRWTYRSRITKGIDLLRALPMCSLIALASDPIVRFPFASRN